MPRFNGTGPKGFGPGRGFGPCGGAQRLGRGLYNNFNYSQKNKT